MASARWLTWLALVGLFCAARGADTLVSEWAGSSQSVNAKVYGPVVSSVIKHGSSMTSSQNGFLTVSGNAPYQYSGYAFQSGTLPIASSGANCGTNTGSYFELRTNATGAPITITSGASVACAIQSNGYGAASVCVRINNGTWDTVDQTPIPNGPNYYIPYTSSMNKDVPANSTVQITLNLYTTSNGNFLRRASFNIYAKIGCLGLNPANGYSTCINGTYSGDTCSVGCDRGYYLNSQWTTTTCTDGVYSPILPTSCTLNTTFCPLANPPINGTIILCTRSIGGTCQTGCLPGYIQSIPSTILCRAFGLVGNNGACSLDPNWCSNSPAAPNNGYQVSCSGYLGGLCVYACYPGYIASTTILTCGDGGQYSGGSLSCFYNASYCPVLTAPGNGSALGCSRQIGGACSFSCGAGYIGSNLVRTCQADGSWDLGLTTCSLNMTFCPLPKAPGNGSLAAGCQQFLGGVCGVACNSSYLPSAPSRTCQSNGQFSGSPITCELDQGLCALPAPPANGNRVSCGTAQGGLCQFSCNPGYILANGVRTCQADGNFSLPLPTCTLNTTYCALPAAPAHGSRGACATSINGVCNFACDTGYMASTSLSWTCQSNGAWSSTSVVCDLQLGFCPVPSSAGLNGVWGTCNGTLGSTCELLPSPGYQLAGPNPVCELTGLYDTPTPASLIQGFCTMPSYGNASITPCTQTVGGSCVVTCAASFTGGGTAYCQSTGVFSVVDPCTPQALFCAVPVSPANGAVGTCSQALGGVCQFSCSAGYLSSNGNTAVCGLDTVYSPQITCTLNPTFCPALSPPEDGYFVACARSIFGACTYACNAGYNPTVGTTRSCGSTGAWDGLDAGCAVTPNYCSPPSRANGFLGSCNATIGSECELHCNPGYSPSLIVGVCDASRGYGSDAAQPCAKTAKYCTDPSVPAHASINQATCTGTVGSYCTVACSAGYNPPSVDTLCQLDGTYDHTSFNCTPVDCGALTQAAPTNGFKSCTGSLYQDTCTFTCSDGFMVSGTASRTCSTNGQWSGADDTSCIVNTRQDAVVSGDGPGSSSSGGSGALIGGVVGALVVVLIILVIIVAIVMRRKGGRKGPAAAVDSGGNATVRLDSTSDGNAERVNMMLAARTTVKIGTGAFAAVYKARMDDGGWAAVKVLEKKEHNASEEFHREVTILSQLGSVNHSNVVHLIFFCPSIPAIVMELAEGGSLYSILNNEVLSDTIKKSIAGQVAAGMACLHEKSIVHLDLKPENVLRGENGLFKISDFGTSLILGLDIGTGADGLSSVPIFVGTPQYSAPERFQDGRIDLRKCDVFSFGVLLWRMYSKTAPFDSINVDALIQSYKNAGSTGRSTNTAGLLAPPQDMPTELSDVMLRCWETFAKRPGMKELEALLGPDTNATVRVAASTPTVVLANANANPVFDSTTFDPASITARSQADLGTLPTSVTLSSQGSSESRVASVQQPLV